LRHPEFAGLPSTRDTIEQRFETAAMTLGGARLWVFTSVTLPLALLGIINGAPPSARFPEGPAEAAPR
jgi:ABC-type molybdate transport system permease subunit